MSIELSRRDFMKCSAVAALAVASGTLLTGCGGGGGSTGVGPDSPITRKGVAIEMERYQNRLLVGDFQLMKIEFELKNNTDSSQAVAASVGSVMTDMGKIIDECVSTMSWKPLQKLSNSRDFQVTAADANGNKVPVYAHVAFSDVFVTNGQLAPGAEADIVLYCAIDSTWDTLVIDYKHLGGQRFIQRN